MQSLSSSPFSTLGAPSRLHDAMWTGLERRTVRAMGAGDAMTHALDWAVSRSGIDAIVLADADGFMICHSQSDDDLQGLAAVLPLLARGDTSARLRRNGLARGLALTNVEISGEVIHIALLGGTPEARRGEVSRICAAVRRILGN